MEKLLAFRLDDITPGLKRDNLNRFEEVFDLYGIKPLIGIVPANEDPNLVVDDKDDSFWDEMRRLRDKGWKIALHGYRHVYYNDNSGILKANPFSEFAGLTYEEQKDMIFKGKSILEDKGLTPEFFSMPVQSKIMALAVLCSCVCFGLWAFCTGKLGVTRVNIFSALIPLVSATASYFLYPGQETFTLLKIVGIVLTIMGVIIVQIVKDKQIQS